MGPLLASPCPWLLQCQLSLAWGYQLRASLTNHTPAAPKTAPGLLLQGPGCPRAPWPWGAAHPQQCPAHTGAAGWESVKGFCHSKRDSNTQESSYCKAKAEPEQCHSSAGTGILRNYLIFPLFAKSVFSSNAKDSIEKNN